ncbi:MAG: stage II sporulation protein M [Thermoleophilaceae bacterium]|nr:stage II sporulation protein M [Thermoleophilaceae bacterium]
MPRTAEVSASKYVNVNDLVLVQGWSDTRKTLREWNRRPWGALRTWLPLSIAIAAGLLIATTWVASLATPDPSVLRLPGINAPVDAGDVTYVLIRNALVLALHGFACIAGFIAGSSLPLSASKRSGLSRWVHEKAGPLAIGFVVCATLFSLTTQAYILGHTEADIANQLGISPALLTVGLLPHALPELTALFLPLAAWTIASRRDEWHTLLAATFVTVGLAVPVLIVTSLVEVYLTPELLVALSDKY